MKAKINEKIEIPEGVNVEIEGKTIKVKGERGEDKRTFKTKKIEIKKEGDLIILNCNNATKREKKLIFSITSHIKNMLKGVKDGFEYKLKICSIHFPMNVKLGRNELIIKNFLGEKKDRIIRLPKNVEVKINGDIITVSSFNKELAGQTAADIEATTKVKNKDVRRFQDGIWIINKAGKEI